jgi:sugar lactone lactonase YvrE
MRSSFMPREHAEVVMQHELIAEVVVDCRSLLGEGVTWDADTATLLWVDVVRGLFHRLGADGSHHAVEPDRAISVVVPRKGGEYVAVAGLDVVTMDAAGRFGTVIATLPPDGDGRANDGRCDPRGRLWVGTVDRSGADRAALFRVDEIGHTDVMLPGRALSNGIDWSPDGRRCYHADSMLRRIDELHLDERGDVIEVREFARFDAMPDGLSVDAAGCVWVALWDRGVVQRFTPDGRLDLSVSVPGGWITNCAFGGADMRTLYITTACVDLDADVHREQPHAGSLFAVEVGVAGRGYTPFGTAPS